MRALAVRRRTFRAHQLRARMPTNSGAKPLAMKEIPASERPRERLLRCGADRLGTHELLAILIGSGTQGRSALDVGRQILTRVNGSLAELAGRPLGDLMREDAVGMARAVMIHAALELGRRAAVEVPASRATIQGPVDVVHLMGARLRHLAVEELHVLMLDSQHWVKRDVTVTSGILNASVIHPREVFREAIAESAAAIVLVHNHPSGDPVPSPPDIEVTANLVEAGRTLGIPVLDHVVIGRAQHVSFAEQRLI